jgi:hypothetical protein
VLAGVSGAQNGPRLLPPVMGQRDVVMAGCNAGGVMIGLCVRLKPDVEHVYLHGRAVPRGSV